MTKPKIGFIGLGWIGKNYADDFEERGYDVVRYSKSNTESFGELTICPIVFIAVPTPSTPQGFDTSILEEVLGLLEPGQTAVIKSTILPGTTRVLQEQFPDLVVMHSPEFLTEATAAHDARHPDRNIIGITSDEHREKAVDVMRTLPTAPFQRITRVEEAEAIKYAGNCWFYFKVLFVNTLYDLCQANGIDYDLVKDGMSGDPRIGHTHLDPIHKSGRGAGGHCFIKDFAAYREAYSTLPVDDCPRDGLALSLLYAAEAYNRHLLTESRKDLDLLEGVYGSKT